VLERSAARRDRIRYRRAMTDAPRQKTLLRCPCGELIEAENEDDLVEKANAHLSEQHPNLAGHYTRDEILFMAY
jgi:hypothetical protein